jgi:hypothetical protein
MIARWCSGLTAACVLIAAAFLAGCSSGTTSSAANGGTSTGTGTGASASSTSAVCKSAANLKASITGLKDLNASGGTSAVSAQVTKIKQDLDALKADAHGEFTTQASALNGALDKLTSSLDAAKASPNAGTLSALASAAGSVVTAGTSLVTAVSNTC